ncbi:hypothetical protein caldi_12760 [Caldinitratiruptor microaerophilus]|uniref:Four-carbon acid sugar kinase family protein n=2 Tax=Caldinitratiruptor microaerophilus TaxID=671077 RepID=A0AA35G7K3_9FIRM|nr:hypothetical protein caldi_12760 [Caldinitratiruptor microaerophilus]
MPPRVLLVADDFTGAADTAVHFAAAGLDTAVWAGAPDTAPPRAEVLAVSTNSRSLPPAAAARAVAAAVRAAGPADDTFLFKKIDSTLRGNPGPELDALAQDRLALVCPAVPAQGRTVRSGVLHVHGRPVAETEFARDIRTPVRTSRVAEVFGPAAEVSLAAVRAGEAALRAAVRAAGARRVVVDAEMPEDLATIARVALDLGAVPCGAAGLGAAIAAELARRLRAVDRLVAVVGSAHPLARAQAGSLAAWLGCPVTEVGPGTDGALEEAAAAGAAGTGSAVLIAPERTADPAAVESALGRAAAAFVQAGPPGLLVVVGGETARAVLGALGATGVRLVGEALPGLPLGRLAGGPWEGLPVVTKAGGFGDPGTLAALARRWKEERLG